MNLVNRTVPGKKYYKDTLITQKKNVVIFGDNIPEYWCVAFKQKLIKSKVYCKI